MKPRDLATQLAVLTVVEDTVKERKDALRQLLRESLDEVGADSVRADLNDERVAKVALINPKPKLSVVDDKAFTAWVAENYPTEVEIVKIVRSNFREHLLGHLLETAGDNAINPQTGEVVAGVKVTQGNGYVSTRFESGGRAKVLDALSNGTLSLDLNEPLALPAGDAS